MCVMTWSARVIREAQWWRSQGHFYLAPALDSGARVIIQVTGGQDSFQLKPEKDVEKCNRQGLSQFD